MAKNQRAKSTRAEWAKRVRAWKKSGLHAAEFAAREDLIADTLRWWSWKLGAQRARPSRATRRQVASVKLVPVRLATPSSAVAAEATTTPIEIARADYTLRIRAGFDRATLVAILDVLEDRAR